MGIFDTLKKQNTVLQLPIEQISPSPFQPRKKFSKRELSELAQSISENGLVQPVSVRKTERGYELIAGERRLRACALIGRKTIEAIVYDLSDRDCAVWALIENLQRSDLGVFDEAKGISELITLWGVSREEAAKRLGIAPSTLSNKLRLLKLSPEVREIITEAGLTERHARELLRLETEELRRKAAAHIAERELSVAETERYVTALCAEKKAPKPRPRYIVKDVKLFINTFEHAVDVMKNSGIGAVSTVTENGENIIYSVTIPKSSAFRSGAEKLSRTAPAHSACAPSVI
ncbi:MAG: ParB/RepB/Spo0J family partition protein [Oscillospiraceae bacterium]